ncbi:hypothetical protein EZS27_014044 [termite gut metagenome]|uniref:DUF3575 domain-containing protein n=1 Tax=termite gut metagenome TaxID=433724 RepID=A0A5J4RV54_9ZZZZ
MNRLLTLVILSLLSVKLLAVLPIRENTAYRDSIYHQIIKEGESQFNCYLSYLQGNSQVVRYYANNTQELDRLDEFIQRAVTESSIYITKISITGYCSIEGAYLYNEQLSEKRIKDFIDFVNEEYNLCNLYPVESLGKGEDWETLRTLIAGSSIPERNEMIQIINSVSNLDEREMRLRILNGGRAYKKIFDDFYPLLRRVNIKVEYDVRRMIEDQYIITNNHALGTKIDSLLQQNSGGKKKKVSKHIENSSGDCPIVFKTNLMSWVGITPDISYRTFMPNVAAEVYLNDLWSVVGSITYAYWNYDKNKQFWGVSGYSVESRYWLRGGNNKDRGVYTGVYVQGGDYDYCLDVKGTKRTDNYTGIYAQAGLSIGYHLQIDPVWGIELGLRGGYQYSQTKIYDIQSPKYLLKEKLTENKIKIDGLNLNVTYRFR